MALTDTPQAAPQLAPMGMFYFFSFGGLGALFPYLPLLLSARGLDAVQISWVMVLNPLSNLLIPPLWSAAADMINARLVLLQAASIGCGVGCLVLLPGWGLWGNLLGMAVLSFFRAPLTSLADAAVQSALGDQRARFGKVRVWGSVGFALCAFTLGRLKGSLQPRLLLSVTAGIYVAAALALAPLRKPPYHRKHNVVRQSLQALRNAPMLLLLGASSLYYIGHSTYDVYFGLYMHQLGFSDGFVGVAWGVGVGVEVGVMLLAPRLLVRVQSGPLLCLCAGVATVRWLLLSQRTGATALLMTQMLHGVTFGLWYLSLVQYVQKRAPDHLRTSLQSMIVASMGLGMVVGYLGGGVVFRSRGGTWLYVEAAACAASAFVVYLVALMLDRRRVQRSR